MNNLRRPLALLMILAAGIALVGCEFSIFPKKRDDEPVFQFENSKKEEEDAAVPYDYPDLSVYLDAPNLRTVTVSRDALEERLQQEKDALLESDTTTDDLEIDTPLQNGDLAVIDFEGRMNGEIFSGGSAEDYALTLGSHTFIDGFEEGLVGVKVGEATLLKLNFPDDYRNPAHDPEGAAAFNGKPVEFTVTVKSATRTTVPTFTDAFIARAAENSAHPYTTVAAWEADMREKLTGRLAMEAFIDACRLVEAPAREYEEAYDNYYKMYETYAGYLGLSLEDYLAQSGTTVEEMEKSLAQHASEAVKTNLAYYYLARTYAGIGPVTDAEFEKGAAMIAEEDGYSDVKALLKSFSRADIMQSILFEKVAAYAAGQVTVE